MVIRAGVFESKFVRHFVPPAPDRGRFASAATPKITVCPASAPGWRQSTEKLKA
jgi:hypothetical protein